MTRPLPADRAARDAARDDAPAMTLRSLLVDFNSYFASVEQQVEPRLRGKPLGVVPLLADTTVCIAASVEAKVFGVKTGTKVAEARRLCPGIEFVIARHELYIDYHHRAVAAVDTVVPVRAVLSIDEMDCELTGRWREPQRARDDRAQGEGGDRASSVGEYLRTSIGIGPNTFIAKTASDMMKPDGLVVIEQSRAARAPVRSRGARPLGHRQADGEAPASARDPHRARPGGAGRATSCTRSGAASAATSCGAASAARSSTSARATRTRSRTRACWARSTATRSTRSRC